MHNPAVASEPWGEQRREGEIGDESPHGQKSSTFIPDFNAQISVGEPHGRDEASTQENKVWLDPAEALQNTIFLPVEAAASSARTDKRKDQALHFSLWILNM